MVPTLVRALGLKGERLQVGSRDNKDVLYLFAALDLTRGRLVRRALPSRTARRRREGSHKTRRLQRLFVRHLGDIARAYPAKQYPRVVVTIDNAPWHQGPTVREALARHTHLELYRLPSYSPQLNVVERLWKLLRHAVTHNRLFEDLVDLASALDRAMRRLGRRPPQLLSLILSERKRAKSCAA